MDNDKIRLRKYEDDLNVSGTGLIVMGGWASVKAIVELFFGQDNVFKLVTEETDYRVLIIVLTVILMMLLLSVIMLLHIYAGINAIRASKGIDHKKAYIGTTYLMLILSLLSLISYKDSFKYLMNIDTTLSSLLVDLTTVYIYCAVIRSSYMIKKIKENQMQE